jgi:hypothetical protein
MGFAMSYIAPLSAPCIVVTLALLLYWEHNNKAETPMREIAGRAGVAPLALDGLPLSFV